MKRHKDDGTMRIGYRTIKTAVGVALSVFITQQLGLQFYATAGILTMLCIQVTRMKSLKISFIRFAACLLGLLISILLYSSIGYHSTVILLAILLLIPLLVKLKLQEGVASSTVVILQIYTLKELTLPVLLNELAVIGIGVGVALLMNLHMPKNVKQLNQLQRTIEKNLATILREFASYLRQGDSGWAGQEIIETDALLEQGLGLALQEVENHLLRQENAHYHYFAMRQKQFELLEDMLPIISALEQQVPHGQRLAAFLQKISEQVGSETTAGDYLDELLAIRQMHKRTPLPQTREEFEIRASLYHLFNEMQQFLMIQHEFEEKK